MTQRDIKRYAALMRMADDSGSAASERKQALEHMAKADAEFPGIGPKARAWIVEQQSPEHGDDPSPGGRGNAWGDEVETFLRGVGRVANAVHEAGRQASSINQISKGSEVVITQPASGRNRNVATCSIVLQPAAVDALLESSPGVRRTAITALAAALQQEMLEFFQP